MSDEVNVFAWIVKPSVSLPTYNLQHQNPEAKDIGLFRELAINSIFWCHVTTVKAGIKCQQIS